MKAVHGALAALLCLAGNAQATAIQVCNVTVDVIDTDPKGTNVRDAPGGRVGCPGSSTFGFSGSPPPPPGRGSSAYVGPGWYKGTASPG